MYDFGDIISIIDKAITDKVDIMFICNYDLASYISDYLRCEYGIKDEKNSLNTDTDEYYVSLNIYKHKIELIVESAKGNSGKYKINELDFCNYYIQDGLMTTVYDTGEYLRGNNCTWRFFEYNCDYSCCCEEGCTCEDSCNCDEYCDCKECAKNNDDNIEYLIDEYVEKIQEVGLCPKCLKACLLNFTDELIFRISEASN